MSHSPIIDDSPFDDEEEFETHCPFCHEELDPYEFEYQYCACGWQSATYLELPNNNMND